MDTEGPAVVSALLRELVERIVSDGDDDAPLAGLRQSGRSSWRDHVGRVALRPCSVRLDAGVVADHLRAAAPGWRVVLDESRAALFWKMTREADAGRGRKRGRSRNRSGGVKKRRRTVGQEEDDDEVVVLEEKSGRPEKKKELKQEPPVLIVLSSEEDSDESERQPKSRCVRIDGGEEQVIKQEPGIRSPPKVKATEVKAVEVKAVEVKMSQVRSEAKPSARSVLGTRCCLCGGDQGSVDGLVGHLTRAELWRPLRALLAGLRAPAALTHCCAVCRADLPATDDAVVVGHYNAKHRLAWRIHRDIQERQQATFRLPMQDAPRFGCKHHRKRVYDTKTELALHFRLEHDMATDDLVDKLMREPRDRRCELCQRKVEGESFCRHLVTAHFARALRAQAGDRERDHREPLRCYFDAVTYGEFGAAARKKQTANGAQNAVSLLKPKIMRQPDPAPSSPLPLPPAPVQAQPKEEAKPEPVHVCRLCGETESERFASEDALRRHLQAQHFAKQCQSAPLDQVLRALKLDEILKPVVPPLKPPRGVEKPPRREGRELSRAFRLSLLRSRHRCLVCDDFEAEEEAADETEALLAHLHDAHFGAETTADVARRVAPLVAGGAALRCPSCRGEQASLEALARHWAVRHRRVLYPYERAWRERNGVRVDRRRPSRDGDLSADEAEEKSDVEDDEEEQMARREEDMRRELQFRCEDAAGEEGGDRLFVQRSPCHLLARDLVQAPPCRECGQVESGALAAADSVCQFEGFRKLRAERSFAGGGGIIGGGATITRGGFLSAELDPTPADRELWLPIKASSPADSLDQPTALFILENVAEDFCKLVAQEERAVAAYKSLTSTASAAPVWKRLEAQVREMCDVCSTTLFNTHFTCPDCCVLVCLDCFQTRMRGGVDLEYRSDAATVTAGGKQYKSLRRSRLPREDRDEHMWPFCHRGRAHCAAGLALTTIIPGDAHLRMREMVHETMKRFGLKLRCTCEEDERRSVARDVMDDIVGKVSAVVDGSSSSSLRAFRMPKRISHVGSAGGGGDNAFSTRQVGLRVDGERQCRICRKVLPADPRPHLLDHLRDRMAERVDKRRDRASGKVMCPEPGCAYGNKNIAYLVDKHLAIFHRYLDGLYFEGEEEKVEEAEQKENGDKLGNVLAGDKEQQSQVYEVDNKADGASSEATPDGACAEPTVKGEEFELFSEEPEPIRDLKAFAVIEEETVGGGEVDEAGDSAEHEKKRRKTEGGERPGKRWKNRRRCPDCEEELWSTEDMKVHAALRHHREELTRFVPAKGPCYCNSFFPPPSESSLEDHLIHLALEHNAVECVASSGRTLEAAPDEDDAKRREHGSGGGGSLVDRLFRAVQVASRDPSVAPQIKYTCQVFGCREATSDRNKMTAHASDHVRRRCDEELSRGLQCQRGSGELFCRRCFARSKSRSAMRIHWTRQHLRPDDFLRERAKRKRKRGATTSRAAATKVEEEVAKEGTSSSAPFLRPGPSLDQLLQDLYGRFEPEKSEESSELDGISNFLQADAAARRVSADEVAASEASSTNQDEDDVTASANRGSSAGRLETKGVEAIWLNSMSRRRYPARHEWLCDGKLLLLEDPRDEEGNKDIFQDQWIRGQPIMIANSSDLLDPLLWTPGSFLRDFGHLRHPLIDCLRNAVMPEVPLGLFWRGFERVGERPRDLAGNPMVLKLKDWPPNDDLAEYMPDRFYNLINSFPMRRYTLRDGALNLASFLPDRYLKPELGPKMYIAYGSALHDNKASTNLHLDMSDAVNVLAYVGIPEDTNKEDNERLVFQDIINAGCDVMQQLRARRSSAAGKLPGALWHIYHPRDTPRIRHLLKTVALERGRRLDPHDDPIHDQSTYLDGPLRLRLYREYGVRGYAIVQCMGDTVFIPAGACHQVRNLHNCIKVAEDFVSPENISHCIHLTQEFRHLTEWHTNHEDKLQVKSILYHAVRTALAALQDGDGR